MNENLLPCPFCGGHCGIEKHLVGTVTHPAWKIVCDNCGASTGYADTDWNERLTVESKNVSLDALRERSEGVSCCSCYFLGTKDINVEYYESSNTCPAGMYLAEVLVLDHEYKCIHPECFKPITIHDPINGATTSDKRVQNYDTLNAKNNCKLYKEKL
jgi:hypothetical protein